MQSIKILLADDQQLFLDAIDALLISGSLNVEVVGHALNGQDAIDKSLKLKPDLILMDLLMDGINGSDAAYRILKCKPEQKILFLSSSNKINDIEFARKIGAAGYILKKMGKEGLTDAIQKVLSIDPEFIEPFSIHDDCKSPSLLTRRERQVLKMVVEGAKNREISVALSISIRTVEKHRSNLMNKLGNPPPLKLVEIANDMGLLC